MPKPTHCVVPGCPNPSHAKGYCRRHYAQIWRHGAIVQDPREKDSAPSGPTEEEVLQAKERELARAKTIYQAVVGCSGRLKWRQVIAALQDEIRVLEEARAVRRKQPGAAG